MNKIKFSNKIDNPLNYFKNSIYNRLNYKKDIDNKENSIEKSFIFDNKKITLIPNVEIIEELEDKVSSTTLCIEDESKYVDIWYYSKLFKGNRVKIELKFKEPFEILIDKYERNHLLLPEFDHYIIPLINAGHKKYSSNNEKPIMQFSYTKFSNIIPFKRNDSDDFSVFYDNQLLYDFNSELKFNKHIKVKAKKIINGYKILYKQCKFKWGF